jgi:hypothetical protein
MRRCRSAASDLPISTVSPKRTVSISPNVTLVGFGGLDQFDVCLEFLFCGHQFSFLGFNNAPHAQLPVALTYKSQNNHFSSGGILSRFKNFAERDASTSGSKNAYRICKPGVRLQRNRWSDKSYVPSRCWLECTVHCLVSSPALRAPPSRPD